MSTLFRTLALVGVTLLFSCGTFPGNCDLEVANQTGAVLDDVQVVVTYARVKANVYDYGQVLDGGERNRSIVMGYKFQGGVEVAYDNLVTLRLHYTSQGEFHDVLVVDYTTVANELDPNQTTDPNIDYLGRYRIEVGPDAEVRLVDLDPPASPGETE